MDNFGAYMMAQEKSLKWFAKMGEAGAHYDNAKIFERLAEIKSQHEPIHSLAWKIVPERDRLYAIAHYVVVGRMPDTEVK